MAWPINVSVHFWRRAVRAREPIPLPRVLRDLTIGSAPAMVVAYASADAAPKDADTMSTIAYPALYGVLTLAAVVLLFEATPFLYRFVTGKIPSGSPRTLKHLDTSTIEAQLRREPLAGFSWVCFTNDSEEEESFARELSHLLERSGWLVRECARGACGGGLGRLKDVLIYLPDGGSLGLRELHELLDRYGYKSAVHNGGGIGSACIQVGQATH